MCIDYQALNKVTIKNKYPIPLIADLFDQLGKERYFTKLDLRTGHYQVRIAKEDEAKMTCVTRYGFYEFLVIRFGLTNAPLTFCTLMNKFFHPFLDKFVVVYLDDIVVYSHTLEEHVLHLKQVFHVLRDNELYVKLEKPLASSLMDLLKKEHNTDMGRKMKAAFERWAGYPEITRTLALVEGTYYWPRMGGDVETFVRTCLICQQDKIEQKKSGGLLEPLLTPKGPWESVSIDFITCLPNSEGGGSIIVVVDRFSKYGTFIAAPPVVTADDTAKLFFKNVASLDKADKKMKKWADEKMWHVEFEVGDQVMMKLLPQQFKSLRKVHKGLIRRYEGPFLVIGRVGKNCGGVLFDIEDFGIECCVVGVDDTQVVVDTFDPV
ncbi:reverse transcriptase [Tanacetum coccineum]